MTMATQNAEIRCKAIWEMLLYRPLNFSGIRRWLPYHVCDTTLSTYLKWLADRYLVYQLPPSGPGKGGPSYAARSLNGALREHLQDVCAVLPAGMRAWRRETGQPDPEEPDQGQSSDHRVWAKGPPIGKPGETWGDYKEWARDKKIVLREEWVRVVSAESLEPEGL